MKRKICVITGTRAEYGLLRWIIKGINDDPDLKLQLVVTGMHLSPEFGLTVREIERDGFPISERVEMLLSSDTETAIATSMGLGMIGFAKTYEKLEPDIIVVLGDRFEIFAAVAAAVPFRIPVAHIHGGESTEGLIDEAIRHAVTKMSHLHFVATEAYRRRVVQMGEEPGRVFCFGAPSIDSIYKLKLMGPKELSALLGIPNDKKIGVVTYHPVTLEKDTVVRQMDELLGALEIFPEIYWIFTMPNADTGGRIIVKKIDAFIDRNKLRGKAFVSLGQLKYLSLLKHAEVMVGNSSSGIIEAPSFALPVVNVGERQRGRVQSGNVINVPDCNEEKITEAISKALSDNFKSELKRMKNLYGKGNSSVRIVAKLKKVRLNEKMIKKTFYEIPQ